MLSEYFDPQVRFFCIIFARKLANKDSLCIQAHTAYVHSNHTIMKVASLLVSCLIIACFSPATAQRMSKAEEAVYELSQSGLLDQYREYRRVIEKHVALFKIQEEEQSARNWIEMRSKYIQTADAFESFIYQIRNDLLDKQMRKQIRKDSDAYIASHLTELEAIYQEQYVREFLPTYISLSKLEVDQPMATRRMSGGGTLIAALLLPVSQATMKLIDFVDEKKEEKLEAFKEVLDEEWVKPNQFRSWEEIR